MKMLRVASCQFPVTADIPANARYIRRYMRRAAEAGAGVAAAQAIFSAQSS